VDGQSCHGNQNGAGTDGEVIAHLKFWISDCRVRIEYHQIQNPQSKIKNYSNFDGNCIMALYMNHDFVKNVSQKWRWGIVAIYTLAIYAFLPFGPRFWKFVLRQWGDSINYLGWFFILVLGTYFLLHLIFQRNEKDPFIYLAFFLISLTCIAILKYVFY